MFFIFYFIGTLGGVVQNVPTNHTESTLVSQGKETDTYNTLYTNGYIDDNTVM